MEKDRKITEKYEAFLGYLFDTDENPQRCPRVAKKLAGYHPKTPLKQILDGAMNHLIEYGEAELAGLLGKSIGSIMEVLDNPSKVGAQHQLAAAREILDRVGVTKKEKLTIENETPNALFILPAKKLETDD